MTPITEIRQTANDFRFNNKVYGFDSHPFHEEKISSEMLNVLKNIVYLQRLIQKHAGMMSAMPSVAGFIFAQGVAYMPAVHQPRKRSVMGLLSACNGLDSGKWRTAFIVPMSKLLHTMLQNSKTAGETANQGFYWNHELTECCEALKAAQLGHLLRLIDDFVCGCINADELELCDPEVATAFRFITCKISRRAQQ